jgi:hypothetical protein
VQRYLQRISGPLLDRTDIHIEVPRLQQEELLGRPQGEPSAVIRERVIQARKLQQERFCKERRKLYADGSMQAAQIRRHCRVEGAVKELLASAIQQLGLSAKAYDRILKLSRTIADLAGAGEIEVGHVAVFVRQHHRHHPPPQGHRFLLAVADGTNIVGVVIVGRPVSRHRDDSGTLEVTRCCTDGTENAGSKLYCAAVRATRALGY